MFVAEHVAQQVVVALRPLIKPLERADRDLARQIRRSASSIALNIAEGKYRHGKDRTHLYRIAAGSAGETRTALRTAMAWGYVDEAACADALRLLDRQLALLWGLTERSRPPSKRAASSARR